MPHSFTLSNSALPHGLHVLSGALTGLKQQQEKKRNDARNLCCSTFRVAFVFFFLAVQRLQFSLLCSFAMDVFSGLVGYYFGKKAFRKLANSSRPPPPLYGRTFSWCPTIAFDCGLVDSQVNEVGRDLKT